MTPYIFIFVTIKSIESDISIYLFTKVIIGWKIKGSCGGLKNEFDSYWRNIPNFGKLQVTKTL